MYATITATGSHWCVLYFICVVVLGNFVLLNLYIAVILTALSAETDASATRTHVEKLETEDTQQRSLRVSLAASSTPVVRLWSRLCSRTPEPATPLPTVVQAAPASTGEHDDVPPPRRMLSGKAATPPLLADSRALRTIANSPFGAKALAARAARRSAGSDSDSSDSTGSPAASWHSGTPTARSFYHVANSLGGRPSVVLSLGGGYVGSARLVPAAELRQHSLSLFMQEAKHRARRLKRAAKQELKGRVTEGRSLGICCPPPKLLV